MNRTPINPWPWSLNIGYNQAELIEGANRQLVCSGQTAVDAEGNPLHPGDMHAQMAQAIDNLETVLEEANMTFENIIRLTVYTTDVNETMKHFGVLGERLANANAKPPMSLLGVTQLAIPGLMFEIEATAAD